jgi:hypothetical protein
MLTKLGVLLVVVVLGALLTMAAGFESLLDVHALPTHHRRGRLVFGIGLPRTGTCSLSAALTTLGRRVQHFPYKFLANQDLYLSKKDAFVDLSMLGVRPLELLEAYPDALFIYTPRDDPGWLRSMSKLDHVLAASATVYPCAGAIHRQFLAVFGSDDACRLAVKRGYEDEVRAIEQRVPSRLLRLDITAPTPDCVRWTALHQFVGGPAPQRRPFPHAHEVPFHCRQFWTNLLAGSGLAIPGM